MGGVGDAVTGVADATTWDRLLASYLFSAFTLLQ